MQSNICYGYLGAWMVTRGSGLQVTQTIREDVTPSMTLEQ